MFVCRYLNVLCHREIFSFKKFEFEDGADILKSRANQQTIIEAAHKRTHNLTGGQT